MDVVSMRRLRRTEVNSIDWFLLASVDEAVELMGLEESFEVDFAGTESLEEDELLANFARTESLEEDALLEDETYADATEL
ncbi:hypothetical protein L2E82_04431 [Cichorium intybus]|uniref:Uncharacterized protein n=1 Tax=Cichorium intybus TaxID=13427 RepID=A0ACB9H5D9_CICIN|nr:hypothetical protein L2E82_04431 [Cichorium intybus]